MTEHYNKGNWRRHCSWCYH